LGEHTLGYRPKLKRSWYGLGAATGVQGQGEIHTANCRPQNGWDLNAEVKIVAAPLEERMMVGHDFIVLCSTLM